jgi:hypothetical protein
MTTEVEDVMMTTMGLGNIPICLLSVKDDFLFFDHQLPNSIYGAVCGGDTDETTEPI